MAGGDCGWSDNWWAPALTLTERLVTPPSGATTPDRARRAEIRLQRWRQTYDLDATGQFAKRLAAAGITQDDLCALLRELPEHLAQRAPKPAWATEVERVVAGPAGQRADDLPWQAAFALVVEPFVTYARTRLPALDPDIADRFAEHLSDALVWLATRTLVLELNVARVTGALTKSTPQERFAEFAATVDPQALLSEYPVLARLLQQKTEAAVTALTELLDRFENDRADIVEHLLDGVDPGPLAGIDTNQGDTHEGRAVAILRFAGGARVVYKPRPVAAHRHFNDVLTWLNDTLPQLRLQLVRLIDRERWGWVEFVEHRPATSAEQVERFYFRQGALLTLLYVLDGTDQHLENLIAAGDQPVLVDVETLFHPGLTHRALANDPAARFLESSVHRTALLPQLLVGDNGALDISGLGGGTGMALPDDVVAFDAQGTDEMRLVRKPGLSKGAANRVRLGDADVNPDDYVDHLVAGFRASYDAVNTNRARLVGRDGLLGRFSTAEVRVIVRNTMVYFSLLDESTHPDVLRDALDRDRVFDYLWALSESDSTRERLIDRELAALWHGDVPMFVTTPQSRDFHEESALERVARKINGMGMADRREQEWIIRASFATRHNPEGHSTGTVAATTAAVPDTEWLLATACGIADEITARGHDDGKRVNWLGLEYDRGWSILPLGGSLYSGYPGVALFLGQIACLTGEQRYADVARRALTGVPWLLDRMAGQRRKAANGFAGLGGLAYALSQLSISLRDDELLGWTEQAVERAHARVETDDVLDVMAGSAGCLAAMLAVHETTGLDAAWDCAADCAELLAQQAEPTRFGSGFAHGSAGIGWALLRFAAAGGGQHYRELGLRTLAQEQAELEQLSWCNGISGSGLARADILRHTAVPELFLGVDCAVDAVLSQQPSANHSLCHGELGNLELITAAAECGHAAAATQRLHRVGVFLSSVDRHGVSCGTAGGVSSPGLLTGLAGVGHGLLRLGFADRVPSVLTLEPLDKERRSVCAGY